MVESFSKRHGFKLPEKEITIRYEAPEELREAIISIAYDIGYSPKTLRPVICKILRKRPDPNNWSEYPNIDGEIHDLIHGCEWFQVYDIIEGIYQDIYNRFNFRVADFEKEINIYFKTEGIGWQLVDGRVEIRGSESFEESVKQAVQLSEAASYRTASNEIHEALTDLSRRPNPDITGAIQHSMAALECIAREISMDQKATLGEVIKNNPDLVPEPLDQSIEKAWGFASEMGRHLREGREPNYEEAELMVGLCATFCIYLIKKSGIEIS